MSLQIKDLSQTPFDTIMACFHAAFEGYFVPMPVESTYYETRWKAAGVNYALSFGAFDEKRLVAFVLHAVDFRDGKLQAFNAATGVHPRYRGSALVDQLYAHALPHFNRAGIKHCSLEVITQNAAAIRVYARIGFNQRRKLLCFKGQIASEDTPALKLEKKSWEELELVHLPNQDLYSWENTAHCIRKPPYSYYEIRIQEKSLGYCVLWPERQYIAQLEMSAYGSFHIPALQSALAQLAPDWKINNVAEERKDLILHLKQMGLVRSIEQYEMHLSF